MKKTILFRVDSSVEIGEGHISRCLALAEQIKNVNIIFISKNISKNYLKKIKKNNFKILLFDNSKLTKNNDKIFPEHKIIIELLKEKKIIPDLLIVDNYKIDYKWESKLKQYVKNIVVIDDLIEKKHNCDILINQNILKSQYKKYDGLIPKNCKKLFGPNYVILRNEFIKNRKKIKIRKIIKKIIISFGSSDPKNETLKVINAIKDLKNIEVDVVVGDINPNKKYLKNKCEIMNNFKFHLQTDKISILMKKADFAIGAAGSSSWERCCLGLPSIVTVLSKDQFLVAHNLELLNASINLGISERITKDTYKEAIKSLNPTKIKKMSENSMKIVDGMGSFRIANEIKKLLGE